MQIFYYSPNPFRPTFLSLEPLEVSYLKETYTLDHKQPNEQSRTITALSEKLQHVFKVS